MAKPGLIVAGAVMSLVAFWLLTLQFYWFQLILLFIGFGTIALGSVGSDKPPAPFVVMPAPAPVPPPPLEPGLAERLQELDALRGKGILKPSEHKRKREQLLDAWGLPDKP